MKIWKDKDGNRLTTGEFFSRWKEGMKGVTQYQQVAIQLRSTYIMLVGIIGGIVITCFNLKLLWWLGLILVAALFNTLVSALGLWQKKVALAELERVIDGVEE